MAIRLTFDQVRHLRLRAQSLVSPQPGGPDAAVQVVRRVCGLQAQDVFAASLGVRVRSTGATLTGANQARNEERSITWTWGMRGTLHLFATDDLDWLLPLLGPAFVAAAGRRREQLGLDEDTYDRGVRAIRSHLAARGPSTRQELITALAAAGLETGYRIERHLLYRAALEGIICMGPDRGPRPTFVLLDDWLGRSLEPVPAEAALARLAARYLAAYAPATPADLAAWSGLPMAAVRTGWDAVAGSLVEVTAGDQAAWLPAARLDELDEPPGALPVRLLPAFDTYLLGYRSRDLIVEPAYAGRVNAGGGMIKPTLLVDGQVAGTWQPNRKGLRTSITVDGFAALSPEVEAGITAETADIQRFLGTSAAY